MNGNSNSIRTFFVHFFTVNWIKIKIITQTTIFSCHITANSNKYSCDNCQKICDNIPIFWSCVYSALLIRWKICLMSKNGGADRTSAQGTQLHAGTARREIKGFSSSGL